MYLSYSLKYTHEKIPYSPSFNENSFFLNIFINMIDLSDLLDSVLFMIFHCDNEGVLFCRADDVVAYYKRNILRMRE